MNDNNTTPTTFLPQQTQIYKGIQDLSQIVIKKFDGAPKCMRMLVFPTLWNTLTKMSGNFCMSFTKKEKADKQYYINLVKVGYYEVEAMFRNLVDSAIITPGHMGHITKTILYPLIKQINTLANKIDAM